MGVCAAFRRRGSGLAFGIGWQLRVNHRPIDPGLAPTLVSWLNKRLLIENACLHKDTVGVFRGCSIQWRTTVQTKVPRQFIATVRSLPERTNFARENPKFCDLEWNSDAEGASGGFAAVLAMTIGARSKRFAAGNPDSATKACRCKLPRHGAILSLCSRRVSGTNSSDILVFCKPLFWSGFRFGRRAPPWAV